MLTCVYLGSPPGHYPIGVAVQLLRQGRDAAIAERVRVVGALDGKLADVAVKQDIDDAPFAVALAEYVSERHWFVGRADQTGFDQGGASWAGAVADDLEAFS